ncbi:MAG: DEAD/DEAH box helicase [Phycisphaerae bacterium]|jgi:hypothetical protein
MGNLANRLFQLPGFQQQLDDLTVVSVSRQFPALNATTPRPVPDWEYLILCATILSRSKVSDHRSAALRIAQTALCDLQASSGLAAAATVILDTLHNAPAIALAAAKGLIPEAYLDAYPTPLRCDWLRRNLDHSLLDHNGGLIRLNAFQHGFLTTAAQCSRLSISAPTSAGKSFIVRKWLQHLYCDGKIRVAVYVVPTRALIQQVHFDLLEDFRHNQLSDVHILTMPFAAPPDRRCVYVLTQERLHILLNHSPSNLNIDLFIVDEAQKVGDDARGVLLEQVIDQVQHSCPRARCIYISPMSANPSALMTAADKACGAQEVSFEEVTVNQNLLLASETSVPRQWQLDLRTKDKALPLGTILLKYSPAQVSKRLPFIAHALGGDEGGNLIYVNIPSDAEKVARQLADLIGADAPSPCTELEQLTRLVKTAIHKDYVLADVLPYGIAFHYGNIPQLIRNEVESLFKAGIIKYLVCTSTLIEGVNLPAKSLFLRAPKRGRTKDMTEADFWNLAGRAGRLGKEFQGNIICVDPRLWKPPTTRKTYDITRTSDNVLANTEEFIQFLSGQVEKPISFSKAAADYTSSYLMDAYLRDGTLAKSPVGPRWEQSVLLRLDSALAQIAEGIRLPPELLRRNVGVNPIAMNSLLGYFETYEKSLWELIPCLPENDNAAASYTAVITRIAKYLTGDPVGRSYSYAILVVNWMRGYPLPRIIADRVRYNEDHDRPYKIDSLIRETMADIEQYARFRFPHYVASYIDVLRHFFTSRRLEKEAAAIPDIGIMLEFGASQKTQLSLMSLGLSRTSAIAISEFIADDSLSENECLEWLSVSKWKSRTLSAVIRLETERILAAHRQ